MQTSPQVRTLTLREYQRVSVDKSGRERSNDEQHGENLAFAERHHAVVAGQPYRDVGSASRYATKARGDFDKLVADLRADRIDEDGLIIWEASRGSRRAGEWASLLDLCEDRGKVIAVTTHERVYNPANPRDRRSLMEDAVDSEYESAKTSQRIRRHAAAGAAEGRPHGNVPFGYTRRYDPVTRRLVEQLPEPDEAAVVREVFERLAAGHSLRAIARDFEARGVTSRAGVPFSSQTLRNLALNPTYAGKRAHAPGARSAKARRAQATLVDAVWPALVDEATFLAVERRLTDPARRTSRPGSGKHLLSMIARCDVCGGPVAATYRRGRREYMCHTAGHVRIHADDLDEYATAALLAALADPERAERLIRDDRPDDAAIAAAEAEVERIRGELDDLADELGRGALSASLAARAEVGIQQRLDVAVARRDDLITPNDLARLIPPERRTRTGFEAAPMAARRQIARLLLAPGKLGELRVTRHPCPPSRVDVAERVTWRS